MTGRSLRFLKTASVAALAALAAPAGQAGAQSQSGTVLFLSDFGTRDGAVAECKGVMWSIDPGLRVVDITHEIPPYDVETAGEVLAQAVPFYPAGTVVVAVVDPGVGSTRRAIAIRTRAGHLLVGPDNGIFTLLVRAEGLDRAVELRSRKYFRAGTTSSTFHGRDIFSPVAAHLAAGVPLDSLGEPVEPLLREVRAARLSSGRIEGVVRYVEDPYGNVVTNIPAALLDSIAHIGDTLDVVLGSRRLRLPWRSTFSDVPADSALIVVHSRGLVSFSINLGDFARAYSVKRGMPVVLRR